MQGKLVALLNIAETGRYHREFIELNSAMVSGQCISHAGRLLQVRLVVWRPGRPSDSEWSDLLEIDCGDFDLELFAIPFSAEVLAVTERGQV